LRGSADARDWLERLRRLMDDTDCFLGAPRSEPSLDEPLEDSLEPPLDERLEPAMLADPDESRLGSWSWKVMLSLRGCVDAVVATDARRSSSLAAGTGGCPERPADMLTPLSAGRSARAWSLVSAAGDAGGKK